MESPSMLERRLAGGLVKSVFLRDRRGGPWTPPSHLKSEPVSFEGNTGAKLAGTWFPADKPRGTVVLVHPDRRYGQAWFWREGWVDLLHENHYDVLTFDLTGYGGSHGPATYYHEDVIAAANFARDWSGQLPVHVIGVSIGAFAVANASPRLDFVESIVLESPYPSFNDWYGKGAGKFAMEAFDRLFPRTARAIRAEDNIPKARPGRILIAMSDEDEVTPAKLTERVVEVAPQDRTKVVRVKGAPHLELFKRSDEYRAAILATLAG